MNKQNLTQEIIRELTTEAYYERGVGYYESGQVLAFEEVDNVIEASVAGTKEYRVLVDLDLFEFKCDCLAYLRSKKPCKHIVAVLLTKVLGKKNLKKVIKSGKCKDKSVGSRVVIGGEVDLKALMKRIRSELRRVNRSGHYWSYVEAQDDFSMFVLGEIQQLGKTRENFRFLLDLAEWIDSKVLTRYDDSDGIFQDMGWVKASFIM